MLQHTATTCTCKEKLQPDNRDMTLICCTLQHTATHCNTLQHAITHYTTLHHAVTHCKTLQHTATHCNTLQQHVPAKLHQDKRDRRHQEYTPHHTATHCNTLQHMYLQSCNKTTCTGSMHERSPITVYQLHSNSRHLCHQFVHASCVLQCIAVRSSELQYAAVRCSALQCVAVRCSALQCVAVRCSAL